jgi:hypothetical protein
MKTFLTKQQIDQLESWQNGKLIKWLVDKMAQNHWIHRSKNVISSSTGPTTLSITTFSIMALSITKNNWQSCHSKCHLF